MDMLVFSKIFSDNTQTKTYADIIVPIYYDDFPNMHYIGLHIIIV